jgi:hypothetical protein
MDSGRSVEVVQKEIEARFGELAELSLVELTEGEVTDAVRRSQRLRSMADGHCLRAAGALESSQAWVADGARSATAWIAWQCGTSRGRASAAMVGARSLRDMPRVEAALLAGDLTTDHVRLLAHARSVAPAAFAEDGEERLVHLAGELRFTQFETAVRYWCHLAAPNDVEDDARRRWLGRRVHCSRTFEGNVVLDALLDPVTGEIVARELERLERELFEADLAEARERVGPGASLTDLARTPAQRRADALRVMAERSAAKPPGALEARVLLQVLTGDKSVERICELSNGTVVTPGEVLPLLDRADVERAIFDGPSKVIDLGVRRRLFTGATRTAVQLRDRQCVHPSCDVPAERCEVDHIQPYDRGGPTQQDNGRCLCKYHHRRARPSP